MKTSTKAFAVTALVAGAAALSLQGAPAHATTQARAAHATAQAPAATQAATYGPIWPAQSGGQMCVDDPSNSTTPGTGLVLWNGCSADGTTLAGEQWTANPSSFLSGTYSIVLKNTSAGQMCITAPNFNDGTQLVIEGCNGSANQAWAPICAPWKSNTSLPAFALELDFTGPVMDLFGDTYSNGTPIVGWHFEEPVPDAEFFPTHAGSLAQFSATCANESF